MTKLISDIAGRSKRLYESGEVPRGSVDAQVTGFFPDSDSDPKLVEELARGINAVEKELFHALSQADPLADVTSKYLAGAGGKRLRPLLTLLAAQCGKGISQDVITAATVVELTHLATLYHDDVMDSAPLRRGTRTAHEIWGNSVAILTGDLIFARASILGSKLGPEVIRIHARTFERLCLGQLHETIGPGENEDSLEHYLSVVRNKTGSLVSAAAHLGAFIASAPADVTQCLAGYGEKAGIAFQLADDIIDIIGNGSISGKIAGTDLRERVPTLPVLLARQAAGNGDMRAQQAVDLIDSDLSSDEDLAFAVDALRALPALDQAQEIAKKWSQEAVAALDPLDSSAVKDALIVFVKGMSARML